MFNRVLNNTKRFFMAKWFSITVFTFGLTVGIVLSNIYHLNSLIVSKHLEVKSFSNRNEDIVFNDKLLDHVHTTKNDSIAEDLSQNISVLCWILTASKSNIGVHTKNTWGKRCTKLIFFSSHPEEGLDVVFISKQKNDWRQTRESLRYLYNNHLHNADWFFKADQDTYSIMENLRFMLYEYDPNVPIFFGLNYKFLLGKRSHMTTRGGFVISKAAIRIFMEYGYSNSTICPENINKSDNFVMTKCFENLGIFIGDTRDSNKSARFHPIGFNTAILGASKTNERNYKFWKFVYSNLVNSSPAVSDYLISFHYINPTDMYIFEYFIYHLRPYGYYRGFVQLPNKKNLNETLQSLRNN